MQHSIETFSHISPAMVHHKKDKITKDEIKWPFQLDFMILGLRITIR